MTTVNRRNFLKGVAGATALAGFNILPSYGKEPKDKLNLAIIGCSQRGGSIGGGAIGTGMCNLVALCDVDEKKTQKFKSKHPDVKVYTDFRKMFDEMGDKLDAVTAGVPDHSHFPIAMRAIKSGVAVYVEKPLAHTFEECELLMAAEKKYKGVCQMGNQYHSGAHRLQFENWVQNGVVKNVKRIDACMNSGRRWHGMGKVTSFLPKQEIPEGLRWDIWCGTAPDHGYNSKYLGGNFRCWHDYGCGAFGDWGPHVLAEIHRFLQLGLPHEIRAEKLVGQNDFIYPMASTIVFEFAERGKNMPALTLTWYDGRNNSPPRPKELSEKRKVVDVGSYLYSDDLVFSSGSRGGLRILPETKHKEMSKDLPKYGKSKTNTSHMKNFMLAAMGKEECNSKFAVAAPLTQVFNLGCIAQRLGGTLKFDTKTKQITNNERANQLLKGNPPTKGWEEFYKV